MLLPDQGHGALLTRRHKILIDYLGEVGKLRNSDASSDSETQFAISLKRQQQSKFPNQKVSSESAKQLSKEPISESVVPEKYPVYCINLVRGRDKGEAGKSKRGC